MKRLISLLLLWFALGVAITATVGHIFGNLALASWFPNYAPMAVSTAACVVSLSISFGLHITNRNIHVQRKL